VSPPGTEEQWLQARALISELKAWDARQAQALGFDPDDVMHVFYADENIRRDSAPPAGCVLLAAEASVTATFM